MHAILDIYLSLQFDCSRKSKDRPIDISLRFSLNLICLFLNTNNESQYKTEKSRNIVIIAIKKSFYRTDLMQKAMFSLKTFNYNLH
jgi:hypothetical protein